MSSRNQNNANVPSVPSAPSAPSGGPGAPSAPQVGSVDTVEAKILALKNILQSTNTSNTQFNTQVQDKIKSITQKLQTLKSLIAPIVEQAKVCAGAKGELDKKVAELEKQSNANKVASTKQLEDLKELIDLATNVSKSVNIDNINNEIKALENEVDELTKVVGSQGPSLPPNIGVAQNTQIQRNTGAQPFVPSANTNVRAQVNAQPFVPSSQTNTNQGRPSGQSGGKKHTKKHTKKQARKHKGGYT